MKILFHFIIKYSLSYLYPCKTKDQYFLKLNIATKSLFTFYNNETHF